MRLRRALVPAVLLWTLTPAALAQDSLPPAPYAYRQLDDPAAEAAARALMEELRCLVCQGQSIADSDAALAGDMRHQVRSRIAAGESPAAVRRWLIDRYGEWVAYDPPMTATTAPLWLVPLAALLLGILLVARRVRRDPDAGDGA